jgi:hypothetical protein
MVRKFLILSLILITGLPLGLSISTKTVEAANADNFKAGQIIDDFVFTNKNSMSEAAIQNFLVAKNSVCLKDYMTPEPLGNNQYGSNVNASRAIWKVSQLFNINPQVIIVTLHKEQGLVTREDCPAWRYQTAMGFACPDGEPCDAQWFGLSKQLYQGARHLRNFYDQNPDWWIPFSPGTNFIPYHPNGACGGTNVNILNRATAALYSYTPYQPNHAALNNLYGAATGSGSECASYGNRNFWRDFTDWFGTTLSGIRLISCADDEYLVEKYIRTKRLLTQNAIKSWGLENAFFIPEDPGCEYPTYELPLDRFARSRNSGRAYFLDSQTAHHIHSTSIARAWGFDNPSNSTLPQLNGSTLNFLTVKKFLPRLAKTDATGTGSVYLLNEGARHKITGTPTDNDSLKLLKGYDEISMGIFSPSALGLNNGIISGQTINYSFHVGGQWYVFDHGKIRAIEPTHYNERWSEIPSLVGPELHHDVVNVWKNATQLEKGFQRSGRYYWVSLDGSMMSTANEDHAKVYGIYDAPTITHLLLTKLFE